MARMCDFLFSSIILIVSFNAAVAAQKTQPQTDETCDGVVYQAKDVSQKAKITSKAPPTYPEPARMHNVSGRVQLTAVLCRSGHVTDIKVVKGLPFGLTESAIESAKQIKFEPAVKDGAAVSQATQLEYGFNLDPPGHRALAKEPVEGRNVELIAVIGLVCHSRGEIWPLIKTRIGSPYHIDQGEQDLKALLVLGFFDAKQTYLRVEEGERGGIGLAFIFKELPQTTPCQKSTGQ
jgi:TonB family protein